MGFDEPLTKLNNYHILTVIRSFFPVTEKRAPHTLLECKYYDWLYRQSHCTLSNQKECKSRLRSTSNCTGASLLH